MVRVLYYLQGLDGGGFALPRGSPFPPGHARATATPICDTRRTRKRSW